jgi:hypothetical protein
MKQLTDEKIKCYTFILKERLENKTLEEIGKKLNLTRERIRQIIDDSIIRIKNKNFRKGEEIKNPIYHIWSSMKSRCNNEKSTAYKNYGGRGIKVCDKWLRFKNFKKDMYESYLIHCEEFGKKNTSIDRINNNGNYELNNCKWATKKEQGNNKRNNKSFNGENQQEASQRLGGSNMLVYSRIKLGWDIKESFTAPLHTRKLKKLYKK